MKHLLYVLLLAAYGTSWAAEPVTVFDLPLGGKLKMPLKQCPAFRLDAEVPAVCWKGSPHSFNKTRLGEIGVPGEGRRPKWAAHSEFSAWIANDGTLKSFDVRTFNASAFVEIINSITGRFGQSKRETPVGSSTMVAEWERQDIYIHLLCAREIGCKTTFKSAAAHADHLKEIAARKAKDDARPASP
jgi:hypothetical protein